MREELPEGWKWKKLEDVTYSMGSGGTPSRSNQEYWKNGGIPWIKISDLSSKYITKSEEQITNKGLDNSSARIFKKGTVLYSIFATIGASSILDFDATTNQAIAGVVPNNLLITTEYLYYVLQYEKSRLIAKKSHATQDNINLTKLRNHKIPLPPLEIQKKIVAIFEKAEQIQRLQAEVDKHFDELIKSIFIDMFGDPVTNPKGWDVMPLVAVCNEIYRYPTFYGFDYIDSGIPVVRISNIKNNGTLDNDLSNYVKIPKDINERYPRTILELNDIVMAVRGDGSTAKRIGILKSENLIGSNISPNLLRFNTNKREMKQDFLYYLLISDWGQKTLEKNVTRTAKKTIKARDIKKIRIFIPPISIQNQFKKMIDKTNNLRIKWSYNCKTNNDLFNSLIQEAFKGELVKLGDKYE